MGMQTVSEIGAGGIGRQRQPNVGARIRRLREQRGLSLRVLAKRSGLSSNAISLIERGENSPTVSSLQLLSNALRVPITTFFEDEHEQATVFVGREGRLRSQSDGFAMESLGIGLRDQQLAPFLVTVEPGAGNADTLVTHYGEELVYCLEGQIEYHVGEESYRLGMGDSLLFEANQPHAFENLNAEPAVLILVFQVVGGGSPAGPHQFSDMGGERISSAAEPTPEDRP
jgi:transcriptional regulator with XRE-family HTH domain